MDKQINTNKDEVVETNNTLKTGEGLYTLRYKGTPGSAKEVVFKARGDKEALEKATSFCNRTGYRKLFVRSFVVDIDNFEVNPYL